MDTEHSEPQTPKDKAQVIIAMENGTRLRVTIETLPSEGDAPIETAVPQVVNVSVAEQAAAWPTPFFERIGGWLRGIWGWTKARLQGWPLSLEMTLFSAALFIYALTRLIGIVDYPIYFFTDEAVQTNLAADFVRDDLYHDGVLLPTYFKNVDRFNLSTSVYVQVIPYLLFGKSVFVTRAVPALITLLGAWAVGMILRDIFKIPYWWAGTLFLSITPAYFLHSRTAFETSLMVAFYAAFLYFYLLYRYKDTKYLYAAVVMGALTFYTYSPGQIVIGLTALLLIFSDLRYHWENRLTILKGLGLTLILAIPLIRFRLQYPTSTTEHLRLLVSYWVQPLPLKEKLGIFVKEYFYGLSPMYWYFPNSRGLDRHVMDGYGNILLVTLPFAVIGLLVALRNIKSSAHRATLFAMLAAPAGAAVVQIGITRVLSFIIPAALLTVIGTTTVLDWIEKRWSKRTFLALALFAVLTGINLFLLGSALKNGPFWSDNYGMAGMQYGARQLFGEVEDFLDEHPDVNLIISPTWTNGADVVARFFLDDPLPFDFGSNDPYLNHYTPTDENTVMVFTPSEYEQLVESGKFKAIDVLETVPYPNGNPGFYFVTLTYVDDIESIFAAELEERRQLVEDEIEIDSQLVQVRHSRLDIGEIAQAFDGDPLTTVTRTWEANPYILEFTFPEPREFSGISLTTGSAYLEITAQLFPQADDEEPVIFTMADKGQVDDPTIDMNFGETVTAEKLRLQVHDPQFKEPGHVHIWEIEFR
ncbi:MAG: glycosyltransferase family 39 protein [Anaerolineales bacterium]|nr:glycosyltransferase family 39 protein [Anaerolineales bacterium]